MTSTSSARATVAEKLSPLRILIADDAAASRDLLRVILEQGGYEVIEAIDGEQALTKAEEFNPDLVILDLQMPKLDGYSVASLLRKLPSFATIPIVALAAALPEVSPDQMTAAGFTQCLVKPISPARLRDCITELL